MCSVYRQLVLYYIQNNLKKYPSIQVKLLYIFNLLKGTMSMLDQILLQAPHEWELASYDNVRFVLKDVDEGTDEFKKVKAFIESRRELSGRTITKVVRIQHPYAYGRHLIKMIQALKHHTVTESRALKFIPNVQFLDVYLEYNCDDRRLPIFEFINFLRGNNVTTFVIIVSKLTTNCQASDSDCYPQYYVELKVNNTSDLDSYVRDIFSKLTLH